MNKNTTFKDLFSFGRVLSVLSSVLLFYHKANSATTRGSLPHTHLDRRAWMESMFRAPETGLTNKQNHKNMVQMTSRVNKT